MLTSRRSERCRATSRVATQQREMNVAYRIPGADEVLNADLKRRLVFGLLLALLRTRHACLRLQSDAITSLEMKFALGRRGRVVVDGL